MACGSRVEGASERRASAIPCSLFDIESPLSAGSRFVIGSLSVFARYSYQIYKIHLANLIDRECKRGGGKWELETIGRKWSRSRMDGVALSASSVIW